MKVLWLEGGNVNVSPKGISYPVVDFCRDFTPDFTNLTGPSAYTRLGLTQNLEPARESRTFPTAGTVNGPSSWNTGTKHGITFLMEVS